MNFSSSEFNIDENLLCTVNVCGNSDGSDWAGRTAGTLAMSYKDDTVTITTQNGYAAENLVIPDIIISDGVLYRVIGIGVRVFQDCSELIGSITFGANISSIGPEAFSGCEKLNHIYGEFDSPPTVGNNAFTHANDAGGLVTNKSSVYSSQDLRSDLFSQGDLPETWEATSP